MPHDLTARRAGLVTCHVCHLLCRMASPGPRQHALCPRCGSALHRRKVNSVSRSWALMVAAAICYIPANLFPMTVVHALGQTQADTIMSGVIYFLQTGMWPIALVIFVASVFVPLMKLTILCFLLISVQRRSRWRPLDRTRLYRLTEVVGRWSMVDVFVVTLLVALIKLGALASIEAGPAAPFFAAVVVLTILAAESFDPRLIWDHLEDSHAES
jgi:paraquat-inducible protein A